MILEKRYYARVRTDIKCVVFDTIAGIEVPGTIVDISESGLQVEIPNGIDKFARSAQVQIQFVDTVSALDCNKKFCITLHADIVRKTNRSIGCQVTTSGIKYMDYVSNVKLQRYMNQELNIPARARLCEKNSVNVEL